MRYVITGAASGIGRAVAAKAAAKDGPSARLMLVDRDREPLDQAAQELAGEGATILTMACDLADPEGCRSAVAQAIECFGGLDTLVSNAGIIKGEPLMTLDAATFDVHFAVNTRPTLLLGQVAHAALAQSRGSIVATASIAAWHPTPPLATYSASKAALVRLVQQMALEWGPDGIRCNSVSPGPTYTGMTRGSFNDAGNPQQLANRRRREAAVPLGKLGTAGDVANAILFLASPEASHITGVDLVVDGGLSLALMPSTGGGQGHSS